jgi:hypothetical protein
MHDAKSQQSAATDSAVATLSNKSAGKTARFPQQFDPAIG